MAFLKTTTLAASLLLALPAYAALKGSTDAGAEQPDKTCDGEKSGDHFEKHRGKHAKHGDRSERGDRGDRGDRAQKRIEHLTEALDLSEQQAAEIAAIQGSFKDEAGPGREDMKALRQESKALRAAEPADAAALEAKTEQLDALQDAKRGRRMEMRAEVMAVLNPEQQAKFAEMKAERRGDRRGEGRHEGKAHKGRGGKRGEKAPDAD